MALNTFGWTPAEVTTDSAGNAIAGAELTVWTDLERTTPIQFAYDRDGTTMLPTKTVYAKGDTTTALTSAVVTSGAKGRFGFLADETYSLVYVWDGSSDDPWPVAAHEALDSGSATHAQAVADAQAAADSAAQSAALVGAPADSAIATAVNGAGTQTRAALNTNYPEKGVTGVVTPTSLTMANLQAAADSAATNGTRLVAAGTITTSSTLTLAADADLSLLTINYTGTGTAVLVGTRTTTDRIFRKTIKTPTVIATAKSGTGWAAVAGTVGVEIANAYGCTITVTRARNFAIGNLVSAYSQGVGYNTINLGHLDNCQTNQSLSPGDANGWVNQNTFVGGRLSHDSAEGVETAGVTHLAIAASVAHPVNNNTWLGSSFEGDTPALHADIAGVTNVFINCRWETVTANIYPKVRWRSGSTGNMIAYGYMAHQIVESVEAGSTSLVNSNVVLSRGAWKIGTSNAQTGLLVLENSGDGTYPTDVVMAPGAKLGATDPASGYAVARSAYWSKFKRAADANPRMKLDHQNGRVYVGNGVADPTRYFGAYGSSSMGFDGGNVAFITDNTYDFGVASARPKYIRAGTAVVTGSGATGARPAAATAGVGAVFFDTTLGKPVWCNGTGWVDSTGTAA